MPTVAADRDPAGRLGSLRDLGPLSGDSLWLAGSRVLILASSVIVAPVVVSQLGAATFGVWALLLAAVGLFGVLGSGSEMVVARTIADLRVRGVDTRGPTVIAVGLAAVESGVLTVVIVLLAPAIISGAGITGSAEGEAVEAMRWLAVSYVAQRIGRAAIGCLSGLGRHRVRAVLEVLTPLLFAGCGVAVLLLGGDLVALSITFLAANVAGAVVALVSLRDAPGGTAKPPLEMAGVLWRLGRPRQISQVTFVIALLAERVLISQFDGGDEIVTGQYAAASTLVTAAVMVLLYALNPLGPELAALNASEGPGAVRAAARKALRSTALVAAAALGALAACGVPLMVAWLGPELEGGHYIAVLAPGFFVWLLARVGFHASAALEEPWLEARSALPAAVLNIALALVVLDLLGREAAGVATATSLLVWAALFARASRELLEPGSLWELAAPALVAAAIAAPVALGGLLALGPDEGSRWGQAALAAALALAFLGLYALVAGRWMRSWRAPSS